MLKLYFLTFALILLSLGCTPKIVKDEKSKSSISPVSYEGDQNWLFWRGPSGTGASTQAGLPNDFTNSLLWTHNIQGGGVPVIAGGKVYQFGYYGVEDDLKEALVCFDTTTGEILWERLHSDFISDIVYNRYGVGAACVDPSSEIFISRQALVC